jgi:Tfp pilus assembly protein PilX
MTMAAVLFIAFWLAASVVSVALMIVHMRRTVAERRAGTNRRDNEVHRSRAQAEADGEEHGVDDMLDAISEYRRRAGRRDIGEELADELLRSTWSD